MMNNLGRLFTQYEEHRERGYVREGRNLIKIDVDKIERMIGDTVTSTVRLYHSISKLKEREKLNLNSVHQIETANNYLEMAKKCLEVEKTFVGITKLEFVNTESHIHTLGGDLGMQTEEIVHKFYQDTNIEEIYVWVKDHEVDLFLVLTEEVDMLSLKLAKLQRSISKQHSDKQIEIIYSLKDHFSIDDIPEGYEKYLRRK
jgi:hypothetical protein